MYVEVINEIQVAEVESLAKEIWTEHYTSIIGAGQVEYMLGKFQSREAIGRQIRDEGFLYFLIQGENGLPAGYMGVVPRAKTGELFLSKVYIKSAYRGKGMAREALRFIEILAADMNIFRITLTVNRNNRAAIQAYTSMGFLKTGSIITDIGSGFVMDDYIFEKKR